MRAVLRSGVQKIARSVRHGAIDIAPRKLLRQRPYESLWRLFKNEWVRHWRVKIRAEAIQIITEYIDILPAEA